MVNSTSAPSVFVFLDLRPTLRSRPSVLIDRWYPAGRSNLIIKVDVEDHELKVLRGAEKAFAERRVDAVFVDGFKPSEEAGISGFLHGAGFALLNARTLESFTSGDTTILAVPAAGGGGVA